MTKVEEVEQDLAKAIGGNASDDVKRFVGNMSALLHRRGQFADGNALPRKKMFGEDIVDRMVVKEVSVIQKAEEPLKTEGRVVCEITVDEDMLNGGGNIHGGCSAFLIDVCTSIALMALGMANGAFSGSVSQSLNVVYHSPAALGDKLRLVNTTLTLGSRAQSARTEIWNDTHHRLAVSGVHIKMQPSASPSSRPHSIPAKANL